MRSVYRDKTKEPSCMRKKRLFLLALFCAVLTACSGRPPMEKVPFTPEPKPVPKDPVRVESYAWQGPGERELIYNDRWKFYVRDSGETEFPGAAALVCCDLTAGEERVVAELEYGEPFDGYWETVHLYPFTGLLGYDGIIFSHESGAAWLDFDFYTVTDAGPEWIATCWNTIFTADLDGDGQLELLSNYHSRGYLDVIWAAPDGGIHTWSLNDTAQDYLGLGDIWVSLLLHEESAEVEAQWSTAPDGVPNQSRMLDLISLWKWEKAQFDESAPPTLADTE